MRFFLDLKFSNTAQQQNNSQLKMDNNSNNSTSNNVIAVTQSLEVTNLEYAHEQYDDFVDIHQPMLDIRMFRVKRGLPLNNECDRVFYNKTAYLKDTDYIEIDRPILEMIGYKNKLMEKKDKHGNLKLDEFGNVKLVDMRSDFNSAIRCLRNIEGFRESNSFDDNEADYVIKKSIKQSCLITVHKGGIPKQELWVRKRTLEHLVIMANTCNSRMIRDYFLDLKRIITEYIMYQTVYRAQHKLSIKDTVIEELRNDIQTLMKNSETQMKNSEIQIKNSEVQAKQLNEKLDIQSQKLDMMAQILYKETDNKVVDVTEKNKKQELVVLRKRTEPEKIEVLRGQVNHVNQTLKRKLNDMEVVGKINTYKNPINLFNRFGESIKMDRDERFKKSSNKVILRNGSTVQDLMTVLQVLDDDKHTTANNVKNCL